MRKLLPLLATGLGVVACSPERKPTTEATPATSAASSPATVYPFPEKTIDGKPVRLDQYAGKVLLIVNTASKCGFTPQYEGLQALYEKHRAAGLEILGFPCDQFGNQEPGTEAEIQTFCRTRYAVTFPLFSKIEVNGPNADPLYRFLRKEQPGSFSRQNAPEPLYKALETSKPELLNGDSVKWNFTKFLVARDGKVVKRFESYETPASFEPEVVSLLARK